MSVFSTNQARQLYVATALKSPNVIASDAAGSIAVKTDTAKNHLYFEYMGHGGLTRSDLIDVKNVMYAKATKADKLAAPLKAATVVLDGSVVAGEDYILKVVFNQFAGISDENVYAKFGMVHGVNDMSASDFYKELAISLAKNFSREATELVKISLVEADGDAVEVTAQTKATALAGSYKSVVITEVEQEWTLGIKPQTSVSFEVLAGDWGTVTVANAGTVKNGKKIADLEYFCMGERADIYRGVGFPNVIPAKYMVDATKEYHVLDIHYAYVGSNESAQKSEKDITIVCADMAELNKIAAAVATATGLTIASLA